MNHRSRFTLTAAAVFASISTATAAPVFTSTTPGQTSVTLAAGTYDIVAVGASGGFSPDDPTHIAGFGAIVEGTFTFLSNTLLDILVGGVGGSQARSDTNAAGGGGGTFIVGASNTPLLIAGGGGGVGNGYSGGSARAIATSGGAGGSQMGPDPQFAGGGGCGLLGDGAGEFQGGGRAYVNGGAGGVDQYSGSGRGGVGGGGRAGLGGGAGGGYTGGSTSYMGGEGGSSFDAGLDPIFSLATFFGDGGVTITLVTPTAIGVPEPQSLALLGIGLFALVAPRRARPSRALPIPCARRPSDPT